jgi:hypothetical protein
VDDTAIEILETSLDEMLNKGECAVCFPDGREETVKLTFAFVQENYERIVFPNINEKQQEVYKKCLYRRLKLTDNEDYRLAVARNALTHEDCGVREYKDGIVKLSGLSESHNGVCKPINDIDKLSLNEKDFQNSGVKVLDLGACKDLLGLRVVAENIKSDTVVILPSDSNGYEQLLLVDCLVKGTEEIRILPSKITLDGERSRDTRIEGFIGLNNLSIRLVGSGYDDVRSHYISVYRTDLESLDIDYVLGDYDMSLDLRIKNNDKLRKLSVKTLTFKQDTAVAFDYLTNLEELNISALSLYGISALDLSNLESLKRFSFTSEESGCINILVSNECEVVVNGTSAKVFRYDRYIEGGKHEE